MKRKKNAAAEITHTAAERTAEIRDAVVDKISPLVSQAHDAITPMAHDAKVKGAHFASKQVDKAQPLIDDAFEKMTPAVEAARDKVQKDILPKISDALKAAAELPAVDAMPKNKRELKKLKKQSLAKLADAKNAVAKPKKKRSAGKVFGTLAIVTALLGTAAVLLRRYLNQTEQSGWEPHEASSAYINTDESETTLGEKLDAAKAEGEQKLEETIDAVSDKADDAKDKLEDLADDAQKTAKNLTAEAKDKMKDAKDKIEDVKEDAGHPFVDAVEATGVGSETTDSYVGENPPEGFVIKGNERSMKYHMRGNSGFERTIADVWFTTEEAARNAGFTKAQR